MSRLPTALVVVGVACAHAPPEQKRVVTLDEALEVLADDPINMPPLPKERLRGHAVMVSFIATYCFPCIADLPLMEKLQNDLGPKGYVTIAVGMDLEGPRVLRPFAEQYALPYPLLLPTPAIAGGESVFGRISELPTRFLFGRDGTLQLAFSGVANPKELIEAVTKVVETAPK